MNAYERLDRIKRCLEISYPRERGSGNGPEYQLSLELNTLRLLPDSNVRLKYDRNPPSGKYVARWAGHVVEGDTPDAAAEALEAKVFGVLLESLGERIKEHETRARDLRMLRETLEAAMRGR